MRLIRDILRGWLLLTAVGSAGCAGCAGGIAPESTDANTTTSAATTTGTGGADPGPCGVDCSKFETPQCAISVCNTGQVFGPLNTCIVVPAPNGTACDDGLFCTTDDVCNNGTCAGGTPNRCGMPSNPCSAVICYEDAKSCDATPANDGAACTPKDLCQVDGVCHVGDCVGQPKDCTFSALNECNTVACDSSTGKCVGTPDPTTDDTPCDLTGDPCYIHKKCTAGQCAGGTPKDCSALDIGCQVGVCDSATGVCGPAKAAVGTPCSEGISECQVGACDTKGVCAGSTAPDGSACNDSNACTHADTCVAGACAGSSVAGCLLYFQEGFEVCPGGWTFGGDWQCGKPVSVGPPTARTGKNVIATQLGGLYSVNQSFDTAVASSPPIDLGKSTNPVVSFWVWDQTEGGTFDGWNMKISTDGGLTFTQLATVAPGYNLTLAGEPAWGGNHAAKGWQNYTADLTAYAGQSVILRFAFRSDGATVYPGVYIDDIVVAEPLQIPLSIGTSSPLPDVYVTVPYSAPIARTGGTSSAVWSIKPGGANDSWLSIDPATGLLTGLPTAANAGPVKVTVHVEEPMLASNFAERTFTFIVKPAKYYTSFEGVCPNGWALTGDWQCGVPDNVGPSKAFEGTQCLATRIAAEYHNSQSWAGTTATSPAIDLTGALTPKLTFRMWVDTEGSTYDGANLQISTDGGLTYSVINNVQPAFPLVIGGKPAWGGHQAGLGWQAVQADLSPYAGQSIRLRFAFHSDNSGTNPGVYIDDILVN